jgi:hypothetical protein
MSVATNLEVTDLKMASAVGMWQQQKRDKWGERQMTERSGERKRKENEQKQRTPLDPQRMNWSATKDLL